MCLVVKERKSKKNDITNTTNVPNYYLTRSSCDNLPEEKHWTIKNKHYCSNKEGMCLTVSPSLKDEGVLVNLMAYEESAKSQQWTIRKTNSRTAVSVINVGTSYCLYEPEDYSEATKALPTTVIRCPQDLSTEYKFYIEPVNIQNRPKCSP